MKDSKKLKAIWLAIDIALVIALAAVSFCCYRQYQAIWAIPQLNYGETMDQLSQQESQLDGQIAQIQGQIDEQTAEFTPIYAAAEEKLTASQAAYDAAVAQQEAAQMELDRLTALNTEGQALKDSLMPLRSEYGQAIRQLEDMVLAGETEYRICYLTFDDGPSYLTSEFLDEIERLDFYGTFFTIGIGDEASKRDDCLRRMALAGHAIANHTYTHAFDGSLYRSVDNFMDAVMDQDEVVYNATGLHTDVVRFPAGSYYCNYRTATIDALTQAGFGWIDWSGNAFDSGDNGYSAEKTAGIVINQVRQEKISVVLMHDWNKNTLGSLDAIVNTLRAENYLFLPLFKESCTIGNTSPKWDG